MSALYGKKIEFTTETDVLNEIKPYLDRVTQAFLSTIGYIYHSLWLETPSDSARYKISSRIRNYFDKQLKAAFGKEYLEGKCADHNDYIVCRLTDELSICLDCNNYRQRDWFRNNRVDCLHIVCSGQFFGRSERIKEALFFVLPDIMLYFVAKPLKYQLHAAISTFCLNSDDNNKLIFPWCHTNSAVLPNIKRYFWVENKFGEVLERDYWLSFNDLIIPRMVFPTFQLFCAATDILMRRLLPVDNFDM